MAKKVADHVRKKKMKTSIIIGGIALFLLGAGIAGATYSLVMMPKVSALVVAYEQELRVQHEYLKACEARMMYLDNVLDKHSIEVIQ